MTEQEYSTVRADEEAVAHARDVKDAHDDSWADVFRFYADRRPEWGQPRKWSAEEILDLVRADIDSPKRA